MVITTSRTKYQLRIVQGLPSGLYGTLLCKTSSRSRKPLSVINIGSFFSSAINISKCLSNLSLTSSASCRFPFSLLPTPLSASFLVPADNHPATRENKAIAVYHPVSHCLSLEPDDPVLRDPYIDMLDN